MEKVTISTHCLGSANRPAHNRREEKVTRKRENIDTTKEVVSLDQNQSIRKACDEAERLVKENDNVGCIILKDEEPRDAYEKLFGKAVADYNAKQTRDERKIENYYDKVGKNKQQHQVYEMVVQVGGKEKGQLSKEESVEILLKHLKEFERRNPNMYICGAYLHMDETTPHIHVDFIPVATGYEKGMEKQAGFRKALNQQGIVGTKDLERKKGEKGITAQIKWEEQENKALEDIVNEHGYEVDHYMKGTGRKHMNTPEYRALQQELETVREEYNEVKDNARELAKRVREVEAENRKLTVENMELSEANERMGAQVTKKKKEVADLNNQKEAIEKNIGGYRDKMMNVAMEKATEQVDKKTFMDGFNAGVDNMYKTVINPFLQAYNLAQEFAEYFGRDGYDPADGR